jgi:hypothetical protein
MSSSSAADARNDMPQCWRCRHFGMGYHRQTPYACRLMGIESRVLPCIEVLRADGVPCRGFVAKPLAPLRSA